MTLEKEKAIYLTNMQDPFYDTGKLPDHLKDDKYFILTAYKRDHGFMFSCTSARLLDDKEFVLHVSNTYGDYLAPVSARLKDDKEVVLSFMKRDGDWLEHASDRLKDDLEVVIASLKTSESATNYASSRIQNLLVNIPEENTVAKITTLQQVLEQESQQVSAKPVKKIKA